jgi:hypothetical protein
VRSYSKAVLEAPSFGGALTLRFDDALIRSDLAGVVEDTRHAFENSPSPDP